MATRIRTTKPPSQAPSQSNKENVEEPGDKRRKTGAGAKMVIPSSTGVIRGKQQQALSSVNLPLANIREGQPTVAPSETESVCGFEFRTREDVDALLNEKMKGKNKTDYKGKSEQMMEYIKKLRSCIKWMMEKEDGLQTTLQTEQSRFSEFEAQMKAKEEELIATIDKLRRDLASLQETFKKEESDKLVALESYRKAKEAKEATEKLNIALSEELRKAQQDLVSADQQIKSIQDINKRMQEYNASLQQYNSKLQTDAAKNNDLNSKLQKEKNTVMEQLIRFRSKSESLQEQLNTSRITLQEATKNKEELKNSLDCLKVELQQVKDERNLLLAKMQSMEEDLEKLKESNGKMNSELGNLTQQKITLEETCSLQEEQIQMLESKLNTANTVLQMADSTTLETRVVFEQQQKLVEELRMRLADAESKISDGEKLRKKLHNTILELKGNIRVFCRVRPLLHDHEHGGTESNVVSYPTSTELLGRGIDLMHNGKKHCFSFDKVFDHEASQENVFVEVSQLVQSALDGYKVCIFAYGQTGSGKTYTMMGRPEESEMKGLIPRSVEQIFQTSQSLQCQGWNYSMQASMLEIYNESIRDLLVPSRLNCVDANSGVGKQYTIKHDQNGNTHVSDLTVVDVCSIKEVSYLLNQAAQSRSVGRTHMNEQSSRSHFVFILRITGVNEGTDQHVQGVLNLIDLAGSERLDKSGATGERLKETQHINKSLLSLSDVISSIAKKEDHIPFRNSKLTYLLQPCLGGESKTLMVVNISPEAQSSGESKCSLQFAAKANSCEIGVPRRQGRA